MDNSHGGVKKCPLTISLKPLDKFDKVVAQGTDFQQKWDFNEQNNQTLNYTEHTKCNDRIHVKEISYAQGKAQNDVYVSKPLAIYAVRQ